MKQNKYITMPSILLLAIISFFTILPQQSDGQSVVISQVYGGGGNSGATYTHDFVELFNRGTVPVSISGWSIQYASSSGTSWSKVNITSGTLQPGQYYLIQLATGGAVGASLPAPDLSGSINMSGSTGKIALVDNQTTIGAVSCPTAGIVEFVGFGSSANCFEGAGPTGTLSAILAAIRANSGCTDTNNNSTDFSASTPTPRNTSTTLHPCSVSCIPPVITCPGTITGNNAVGLCGANVAFSITSTGTSPTITFSHAPGSFFPVGTTTVTATATNACGSDQCTFNVTVNDIEPPSAMCQNVVLSLDANGVAVLTPALVNNNSTDNCPGNLSYSLSRSNFSCADIGAGATVNAADLFISEYIEGSSNNKCIEIFNGTGASVDLAAGGYQIKVYANGAGSPTSTTNLSGIIASGDVFVICNTSATSTFTSQADQLSGNMSFNGDDAVELFKSSTNQTLDIFGQIGVDPGTAWSSGSITTLDRTLRRMPSVSSGNTVNAPGFPTLGTEWDVYPTDNADNLGSHVFSPAGSGIPVTLTVTDAAGNSSTCTANITVIDDLPPTASCQNHTVYLDANGVATITALDINLNSSDNCSSVSLSIDRNSFSCADLPVPPTATTDLIISEYVEGSSLNKYVEIYNGTGATVNLSGYELRLYSNGSATVSNSVNLGFAGTLASGSTVVFANSGATAYSGTVFTNNSVINFNGDDALELFNLNTNTSVDIFGEIGNDPGTEWSVGGNSTAENSLRRKLSVTSGNTINGAGFPTLGSEWDALPQDDISGLGFHGSSPNTVTLTVTDADGNSSLCTATITVIDNIAPNISCPADINVCEGEIIALVNATATDNCAGVVVTNNAPVNYLPGANIITWTATDASGNIATCTQTVTVHYLNATASATDVLCFGGNTGSITVTNLFTLPVANPSDILYSLDGGTTTQSSNEFTGLTAGNYTVTLINTATNCTTLLVPVTVNQPLVPLTIVASATNTCPGATTGVLSAIPSGGTQGYTIEWEDALGVKVNTPGAVGTGTYTVTVTDANGCTATGTATVGQLTAPTVTLGDYKVVFYGALGFNGCHTLTANATGTGLLNYFWTSTQPSFISTNSSTINVCVTTDMMYTYTVMVTDANGCTATASVNVIYTNIDCSSQQNAGKVTICLVPPGNPSNCKTVCIGVTAAQALLNNGSYLGPCLPNCAIPQAKATTSAPLINNDVELNVYPNPTSGNVHIEYRSETDNAELIVITDLQGRIIKTIDIKGAFEFYGNVDISGFDNGIYFINITGNNSVIKTSKLVKAE